MDDIRVVLQARMSSTRLPGKALLPIGGRPSVVLAALRAARNGLPTVVATSTDASDDPLTHACVRSGLAVIRGPLHDVLGRFVQATADLPPEGVVVRLTGDNVIPDADLIDAVIRARAAAELPYLGIRWPDDGLPYGVSVEVFLASFLREAATHVETAYEREHVTPWMSRQVPQGGVQVGPDGPDRSAARATIDTFSDYLLMSQLFHEVADPVREPWDRLCGALHDQFLSLSSRPTDAASPNPHVPLVLGTAQWGMRYGRLNRTGVPGETELRQMVSEALRHGITCFDTAREYGESERRIGRVLSDASAVEARVVTKLGHLTSLPEDARAHEVATAVDASVFRSCRELRRHRLETVLVHRTEHLWSHGGSVWRRLAELRDEGVVEHVGASLASPSQMADVIDIPELAHLQVPVNLLDHRWDGSVTAAVAARPGVTVHARSVFLQGLLARPAPEYWPRVPGVDPSKVLSVLADLVHDLGRADLPDLALAYVRGLPWLHGIVVGTETLAQLQENIGRFRNPPLQQAEIDEVRARLPRLPVDLLQPDRW